MSINKIKKLKKTKVMLKEVKFAEWEKHLMT